MYGTAEERNGEKTHGGKEVKSAGCISESPKRRP